MIYSETYANSKEHLRELARVHNEGIDKMVAKMVSDGRSQAVIDSFLKAKIDPEQVA